MGDWRGKNCRCCYGKYVPPTKNTARMLGSLEDGWTDRAWGYCEFCTELLIDTVLEARITLYDRKQRMWKIKEVRKLLLDNGLKLRA